MKPEVIRLCTRRAILKDIHKDQKQAAHTSWSLPTIVGGQYELESEQSMNTHQPESKLLFHKTLSLTWELTHSKCRRSHGEYNSMAYTQGQA